MKLRTLLLATGLFVSACATTPKGPPTAAEAAPPRTRDSVPDKIAAQQAAAPHALQLESENERWGFDAARERRRAEEKRKTQPPPAGTKAVDVTAPGTH